MTWSLRNSRVVPVPHGQRRWFLFHAPLTFEDVVGSFSEEERNGLEGVRRKSQSTAEPTLLFNFDGFVPPLLSRKSVCSGNNAGKVQVTCTNAVWHCHSWMQTALFLCLCSHFSTGRAAPELHCHGLGYHTNHPFLFFFLLPALSFLLCRRLRLPPKRP